MCRTWYLNPRDQIKEKDTSIHLLQTLLSAPKQKDLSVELEDATQEIAPHVLGASPLTDTLLHAGKEQSIDREKQRKRGVFGRVISAVFDN